MKSKAVPNIPCEACGHNIVVVRREWGGNTRCPGCEQSHHFAWDEQGEVSHTQASVTLFPSQHPFTMESGTRRKWLAHTVQARVFATNVLHTLGRYTNEERASFLSNVSTYEQGFHAAYARWIASCPSRWQWWKKRPLPPNRVDDPPKETQP